MTIDEVKKCFNEINSINLKEATIDEIKELLRPLFQNYNKFSPTINPNSNFYRAIKYNEKPHNIRNLVYPPNPKMNRANRDSQTLFYCSFNHRVPFFELDVNVGDQLVVSQWVSKKELLVNNVGFSKGVLDSLGTVRPEPRWTQKPTDELSKIIDGFLDDKFCRKIYDEVYYKLTVAIAEKMFSDDELFDGLMYPSIAMIGNGDNLAFKKRVLDNNDILFLCVRYVKVTKKEPHPKTDKIPLYEISTLDYANSISSTGRIEWIGERKPL